MRRIPKWWRKFKLQMTAQDLIMGRKVMLKSTLNGTTKYRIERVEKPQEILSESPTNV